MYVLVLIFGNFRNAIQVLSYIYIYSYKMYSGGVTAEHDVIFEIFLS